MPSSSQYDAIVVGSGPNGLAAAVVLARAGLSVLVREAEKIMGGGARSLELTLPGFRHDLCSAVYPLGVASPFFQSLPLGEHGLEWIHPPVPMAHPLDGGNAASLHRSVERTAAGLGEDGPGYRRLMEPFLDGWNDLVHEILAPPHVPRRPIRLARFGLRAILPASLLARRFFRGEPARALFAGLAAHSILPLESWATSAFGLVLGLAAHGAGWPIARGGAQSVTDALASYLRSLGGEIETESPVESLDELSSARVVLCDVAPRQLLHIAGHRLPEGYRQKLERYRYGPGVFKMDWALDAPVPWKAEACARAGTVHVGGTLDEIRTAERAPWEGGTAAAPFVLVSQPTLFDASRAPEGKHIVWAYCHVPHGSTEDASERIEAQIERYAPGFRDRVLAKSTFTAPAMEEHNRNLVGGDITGGACHLGQLFLRPTWRLYRTPLPRLFLCSSSTPPGGGVHGMCGYFAARAALRSIGISRGNPPLPTSCSGEG